MTIKIVWEHKMNGTQLTNDINNRVTAKNWSKTKSETMK